LCAHKPIVDCFVASLLATTMGVADSGQPENETFIFGHKTSGCGTRLRITHSSGDVGIGPRLHTRETNRRVKWRQQASSEPIPAGHPRGGVTSGRLWVPGENP
jgi:hypothetical protein